MRVVTVTWTVKAVEEWCEERGFDSYSEASKRFGRWIHGVSYESCFELMEEVEKYLESRAELEGLLALKIFCGATETEIGYNERIYNLLKEALMHVAEKSEKELIRSHAKALIELIMTAENLKSDIICSG